MSKTMIDLFSGIGGFRIGFAKSGAKCVGHCEIDKYANLSYNAIHDIEEGEWFASDISKLRPDELPKCDIITAGFPCQDISVSGRGGGLSGNRSRLFFEITRIIEGKNPEDKPRWIVLENVKNLLSINEAEDFTTVLCSLSDLGYDCEYQVLNSKDFGVPQNRERVFIVGHLRGRCRGKVFPIVGANTKDIIQLVKGRQGKRVYDPNGIGITLTTPSGGMGGKTGLYAVSYNRKDGIGKSLDNAFTLTASDYRDINRNQNQTAVFVDMTKGISQITDIARCIKRCYNSGISVRPAANSGVLVYPRAIITPERGNKRQNGRRMKDIDEPMFTLTVQDRHGVVLTNKANDQTEACGFYPDVFYDCRIRRLTPKECWRLQGVDDELFYKAQAVCSETQLYRQAGNGVTINVVYEIAKKLMKCEAI